MLRDLGAPVQNRLSFYHDKTGEFLRYEIKSKDTILLHGHDASRSYIRNQDHAYVRNTVLQYFSNQKLIFFPKDQDKYSNHSILALDKSFFSTIHDLTIMTKNENSYEFLKKTFEQNKIVIVPDLAFMVGDMQPVLAPRVDILVLRRTQGFEISEWSRVISRKLQAHRFFSYLVRLFLEFTINIVVDLNLFDRFETGIIIQAFRMTTYLNWPQDVLIWQIKCCHSDV